MQAELRSNVLQVLQEGQNATTPSDRVQSLKSSTEGQFYCSSASHKATSRCIADGSGARVPGLLSIDTDDAGIYGGKWPGWFQ
jgi:hypothetical protein